MRIDAHHHLWDPARGDYGWLTADMGRLYRPFSVEDLAPLLAEAAIDGTLLVQAAPTEGETDWLIAIARATPWVWGVVGWVDLDADERAVLLHAGHASAAGSHERVADRTSGQALQQNPEQADWLLVRVLTTVLRH